jgi:hypothetical protein
MLGAIATVVWMIGYQFYEHATTGVWIAGSFSDGFASIADRLLESSVESTWHDILYVLLIDTHVALPGALVVLIFGSTYLLLTAELRHLRQHTIDLRRLSAAVLLDESSGVVIDPGRLSRAGEYRNRFRRSAIH